MTSRPAWWYWGFGVLMALAAGRDCLSLHLWNAFASMLLRVRSVASDAMDMPEYIRTMWIVIDVVAFAGAACYLMRRRLAIVLIGLTLAMRIEVALTTRYHLLRLRQEVVDSKKSLIDSLSPGSAPPLPEIAMPPFADAVTLIWWGLTAVHLAFAIIAWRRGWLR